MCKVFNDTCKLLIVHTGWHTGGSALCHFTNNAEYKALNGTDFCE